jgi:predicted O-methyltransferase YrrM
MPTFTTDWVTSHLPVWRSLLARYAGAPNVTALEIGVYEGRSTLWFLTEILTHETSQIVCIDPWYEPVFIENIEPYRRKVLHILEDSHTALRDRAFAPDSFSFIYVDGDHDAWAVLDDAVHCFRILAPGGILIFDDYLWESEQGLGPVHEPKMAIDAFLQIFEGKYLLLHKGAQVAIEKTAPTVMDF